jgi:hypothetical protein
MRFSLAAGALVTLAAFAPAGAQTPSASHSPAPHPHKTPFMTFANPAHGHGQPSAGSSFCNRNSVAAQQQKINPITGQPQAQTLVSVPLTSHAGSVPAATTRQQQLEACAHPR